MQPSKFCTAGGLFPTTALHTKTYDQTREQKKSEECSPAKGSVFCSGRALSGVEMAGGGEEVVDKGETKRKGREAGEDCHHGLSILFKIFYKEKKTPLKSSKHHNIYFSFLSLPYLQTTRQPSSMTRQALTEK